MCFLHLTRLLGLHTNGAIVETFGTNVKSILGAFLPSGWVIDPALEGIRYPLMKVYGTILRESGYFHLQATKPDTVGMNLANPIIRQN